MIPINTQEPLKTDYHPNGHVKVHSIFATIQGEGPNAGIPAVFLRLAGCNLQCPGCDTEYTLGAEEMTPDEVVDAVILAEGNNSTRLVVITGGEPFRQDISRVVMKLHENGYEVQVESNGTLPIESEKFNASKDWFSIVVSPKTGKINESLRPFISAFKYVLDAQYVGRDGLPNSVLGMPASPARPHFTGIPVYLQPADYQNATINKANQQAVIESCMKFGYRYCAQLHKFLNLP